MTPVQPSNLGEYSLAPLFSIHPYSRDEIEKIFYLEYAVRCGNLHIFHPQDSLTLLCQQIALKLLHEAKTQLRQRPLYRINYECTNVYKVARDGFKALQDWGYIISEKDRIGNSAQQVFVNETYNVVFKAFREDLDGISRSRDEEHTAGSLLNLFSCRSNLPTYLFHNTIIKEFGIPFVKNRERGHLLIDLTSEQIKRLKFKCTNQEKQLIDDQEFFLATRFKELENYHIVRQKRWFVRFDKESPIEEVNFEKIIDCFEKGLLQNAEVGAFFKQLQLFSSLQKNKDDLYRAIIFYLYVEKHSYLDLLPDFSDPKHLKAYERCEKYIWSYVEADDHRKRYTSHFSALRLLWQFKNVKIIGKSCLRPGKHFHYITTKDLELALETPMLIRRRKVVIQNDENQTTCIPSSLTMKLYMKNMQSLQDLLYHPTYVEAYKNASMADYTTIDAFLAALVQCQDLHAENIGFVPKHESNNQIVLNPVFFDLDLFIGEKSLALFTYKNKFAHINAIRSGFLQTTIADDPFSSKKIDQIFDALAKEERIKKWIQKGDAPIYQHIHRKDLDKLKRIILPILREYQFRNFDYDQYDRVGLAVLRNAFINKISHTKMHAVIWDWIKISLTNGRTSVWKGLWSKDPETELQTRKKIASQLFPRLTVPQQEALLQRFANVRSYLQLYTELFKENEDIYAQLYQFLNAQGIPLTSFYKKSLIAKLIDYALLPGHQNLKDLRKRLQEECEPTFRRVIYSMYPLLPEVDQLMKLTNLPNSVEVPGHMIGNFEYPLETFIRRGKKLIKKNHKSSKEILSIIGLLKKAISDRIHPPSFFMSIGDEQSDRIVKV